MRRLPLHGRRLAVVVGALAVVGLAAGSLAASAATRHSSASTTLVGVSGAGLEASPDGGLTWQALTAPGGQIASLAAATDGSVLLAGTTNGLYRSVDAGKSWQPTGFTGLAITVAIAPNDARVLAVVDDKTRFFRSDDGGVTWPGPR